jgi:protein ImuB
MFCCLVTDVVPSPPDALELVARACSPRVEPHGPERVLLDVDGLARVWGPPDVIARDIQELAASQGMSVRVAIAGTKTAAWLLAHARQGPTVVSPGGEADALAALPVGWLGSLVDLDEARPRAGAPAAPAAAPSFRRSRGGVARHYRVAPPPPARDRVAPPPLERDRVAPPPLERDRVAPPPSARDRVAPPPLERGGIAPTSLEARGRVAQAPSGTGAQASRGERPSAAARQLADTYREHFVTFERWGLRTLGDVAALPQGDVHARMGPAGVRLHQAARGEDVRPLVPAGGAVLFADRLQLEWPIEGLEPLSFVLARQCERLSAALERADRGAVAITTRLTLVTRDIHERVLALPSPMRDARVLRTLILLDLESHPPPAGIDLVELVLDVTPGRILQGSLLAKSLPAPEDLATLVARLGALMGESRVGAPVLLDTHDDRQAALVPFRLPKEERAPARSSDVRPPGLSRTPGASGSAVPRAAFRRFRLPVPARVTVDRGTPVRVVPSARGLAGGLVVTSAGPWRSSGGWWTLDGGAWDRDVWDVQLADGGVYRLARHRTTGAWELEGSFD